MRWEKTITKEGLSVLAGLNNDTVEIVEAWAGTGVSNAENLHEETALVNRKQALPIIEDAKLGNKRVLRLQLDNSNLQEGYMLNQIGVFIRVNGRDPILYYLAEKKIGDDIPSHSSVAGFVVEYVVTIIFSSNVNPVISCNEIGYITADALDARLASLNIECNSQGIENEIAELREKLNNLSRCDCESPGTPTIENPIKDGSQIFQYIERSISTIFRRLQSGVEDFHVDTSGIAIEDIDIDIKNYLDKQIFATFRKMQSGIEPFDVAEIVITQNQSPSQEFTGNAEEITYSNAKFPEVKDIKQGLDLALETVQHVSWDG